MKKLALLFLFVSALLISCKSTKDTPKNGASKSENKKEYTLEDFNKIEGMLDVMYRENGFWAVNKYPEGWIIYDKYGNVALPPPYYGNDYCQLVKINGEIYIRVNIGSYGDPNKKSTTKFFKDGKEAPEYVDREYEDGIDPPIIFFTGLSEIETDMDLN